jgi:hypothetical protein
MQENTFTLKMVMKNGHVIALYADEQTLAEMASHPKFLKMKDNANDIFVSIEDICAFEILNNRKEVALPQVENVPTEQVPIIDIATETPAN